MFLTVQSITLQIRKTCKLPSAATAGQPHPWAGASTSLVSAWAPLEANMPYSLEWKCQSRKREKEKSQVFMGEFSMHGFRKGKEGTLLVSTSTSLCFHENRSTVFSPKGGQLNNCPPLGSKKHCDSPRDYPSPGLPPYSRWVWERGFARESIALCSQETKTGVSSRRKANTNEQHALCKTNDGSYMYLLCVLNNNLQDHVDCVKARRRKTRWRQRPPPKGHCQKLRGVQGWDKEGSQRNGKETTGSESSREEENSQSLRAKLSSWFRKQIWDSFLSAIDFLKRERENIMYTKF